MVSAGRPVLSVLSMDSRPLAEQLPDPIELALAAAIREIAARRAADAAGHRARLTVVHPEPGAFVKAKAVAR